MSKVNNINSIYAEYNTWFKEHTKTLPVNTVVTASKVNAKSIQLKDVKQQIDDYFENVDTDTLELHVSKHRRVGEGALTFIMPGCELLDSSVND